MWISNFVNLKNLTLHPKKLPKQLYNLTNLNNLDLSYNNLTWISNSIWNLVNLTSLNLNNNHIKLLPNSIWNLTKMQNLYLSRNKLITLPFSIQKLHNLTYLGLDWNNSLWNLSYPFYWSSNPKMWLLWKWVERNGLFHFNEKCSTTIQWNPYWNNKISISIST